MVPQRWVEPYPPCRGARSQQPGMQRGTTRTPGAADACTRSNGPQEGASRSRHQGVSAAPAPWIDRSAAARQSCRPGRRQAAHCHQGTRRFRQDLARAHVAQPAAHGRCAGCMALARHRRRRAGALLPTSGAGAEQRLRQGRRLDHRPDGGGIAGSPSPRGVHADQRAGRRGRRCLSVPRRLSPDQPSVDSRGDVVLHRECAVACACGGLHALGSRTAARATESTKRSAGSRCVDAAF